MGIDRTTQSNRGEIVRSVIAFAKSNLANQPSFTQDTNVGKTQFQNILRASQEANSREEFELYIAYKGAKARAARNPEKELWNGLDQKLIAFINEKIVPLPGDAMENLRLAMGYLMWAANAAAERVLDYV